MHHPDVAHEAVLPLVWTPTRGNDIPPHAAPFQEGPHGQLYIARGLLGGEMHIGTTSHLNTEGARLCDRYGRSHAVYEYEVLTCASSMRFVLEAPQPLTPGVEMARVTPRLPVRRDSVSSTSSSSSCSSAPPPKKTLGKLVPFPWMSPPRGQPATIRTETGTKKQFHDPPPYTSPPGGWVEVPKHAGPIALSQRESVQFKHLTQSKCFTLIDDTPSMQFSWSQARAALGGIIETLSSDDRWGGMDVRFVHHAHARPCVKTRDEFESVFNSVTMWRGEKTMATKAAQVFEESFRLFHETPAPKPIIFLIITDGLAYDAREFLEAVIYFCQKINGINVPSHMFRIHLLQMGEDRNAVQPLHDFRDRITQRDRDRRILNVVSFHRGRGPLNSQNIFKLLLASTHVPVDEDPDIGERLPPEVIEGQFAELERIRMMGSR